jgi:hypothetical protein
MNPDAMRARFADLSAQRDTKLAASEPLREQRDAIVRQSAAQVATFDAQIAAAEAGLGDIAQEMAMISRALNGKVGDPDQVASASSI